MNGEGPVMVLLDNLKCIRGKYSLKCFANNSQIRQIMWRYIASFIKLLGECSPIMLS